MKLIYKKLFLTLLFSLFTNSVSLTMDLPHFLDQSDIMVGFDSDVFPENVPGLTAEALCESDNSFRIDSIKESDVCVYFNDCCKYNSIEINIVEPLRKICKFVYEVGYMNGLKGSHNDAFLRGEAIGWNDGFKAAQIKAREELSFIKRHPKKSAFGFTMLGAAIPVSIGGLLWWKTRS